MDKQSGCAGIRHYVHQFIRVDLGFVWLFSNGQAERLRRYSPLCYVAPILPAQPPLKVRYHALTGFPVSAFM